MLSVIIDVLILVAFLICLLALQDLLHRMASCSGDEEAGSPIEEETNDS